MRLARFGILAAVAVFKCVYVHGQSVADIARQSQQRAANNPTQTVITNEDLPKSGGLTEGEAGYSGSQPASHAHNAMAQASERDANAKSYRMKILGEKTRIADLKARIASTQASIHYSRTGTSYYAAEINEEARARTEQVHAMEQQLEMETRQLEDLQESARKAGFGSAVYDP